MIDSKEKLRSAYPLAKERSLLPTMGQMLNDQTGVLVPAETQGQMVERYKADL